MKVLGVLGRRPNPTLLEFSGSDRPMRRLFGPSRSGGLIHSRASSLLCLSFSVGFEALVLPGAFIENAVGLFRPTVEASWRWQSYFSNGKHYGFSNEGIVLRENPIFS